MAHWKVGQASIADTHMPTTGEKIQRWLQSLNAFDLKLLRVPLFIFTVAGPTIALLLDQKTAAFLLLLTGIAGMLYLRLEDIVELEMSYKGLKAKLEKSITEANATVTQLRTLASTLAGPVVVQLALSGQFMKNQTMASKQSNINEIAKYLKQLGVSDHDLQHILVPWKLMTYPHVFRLIYQEVAKSDPEKAKEMSLLRTKRGDDVIDERPESVIRFFDRLPSGNKRLAALQKLYIDLHKTGCADDPSLLDQLEEANLLTDNPSNT